MVCRTFDMKRKYQRKIHKFVLLFTSGWKNDFIYPPLWWHSTKSIMDNSPKTRRLSLQDHCIRNAWKYKLVYELLVFAVAVCSFFLSVNEHSSDINFVVLL